MTWWCVCVWVNFKWIVGTLQQTKTRTSFLFRQIYDEFGCGKKTEHLPTNHQTCVLACVRVCVFVRALYVCKCICTCMCLCVGEGGG